MSWSTEPVSQFLIFTNRGHLEGLPLRVFLVGDWRPDGGGWKTGNTRHEVRTHQQSTGKGHSNTGPCVGGRLCLNSGGGTARRGALSQYLALFGILQRSYGIKKSCVVMGQPDLWGMS